MNCIEMVGSTVNHSPKPVSTSWQTAAVGVVWKVFHSFQDVFDACDVQFEKCG